jgi:hypothetical protein
MKTTSALLLIGLLIVSCNGTGRKEKENQKITLMITDTLKQYSHNRDFLKRHVEIVELTNGNASIVIVPGWQGRVMTSTSTGDSGFSFGWINHDLISSGKLQPHINPFGGEERLWLGPEGGQYSIFFEQGKEFVYDNWQTPDFLDTKPFDLDLLTDSSAYFSYETEAKNYSGTLFRFRIEREVTLLKDKEIARLTGTTHDGVNGVAYRSVNRLINTGDNEWRKENGLLSIWMLGMFNPSPAVIVVIPFVPGETKKPGPPVNDNYFGRISADRLKVAGNHVFFKADGKSRGKIGIPPLRSTGRMGSFDSENNILTLLMCDVHEGVSDYVNSAWEVQDDPYSGDALNSYNDGPLEDGSQMGPFYELESSSPAAALKPGESMGHTQVTLHFTGDLQKLDEISRSVLGITLEEIKRAL